MPFQVVSSLLNDPPIELTHICDVVFNIIFSLQWTDNATLLLDMDMGVYLCPVFM